jgi:hypothetical protein
VLPRSNRNTSPAEKRHQISHEKQIEKEREREKQQYYLQHDVESHSADERPRDVQEQHRMCRLDDLIVGLMKQEMGVDEECD